jgi:hypothetical protein
MKTTINKLFNMPMKRIWISGAGGAIAGALYAWLSGEAWYLLLVTAGGGMLVQWLEIRWARHKMKLLLKAKRKARGTI